MLRIRIGFSVDPDTVRTYPDPAFFVNADPDPEPATGDVFITQLHFRLELSSLLWASLALLDPDPYSQCGSGSSRPNE